MVYIIGQTDMDMGQTGKDIMSKIQTDKKNFMMNGDKNGIGALRVLLGEIQRDPDKDYSDENATKILRVIRKQTLKNPNPDHLILNLIDTYIEPMVSDIEVEAWMQTAGYTFGSIMRMGKSAYKIIGEAKKHFKGRDFSADHIKTFIEEVLSDVTN